MKTTICILIFVGVVAGVRGQIPVTDVAGLLNNKLSQLENIAKWTDSIAQLKAQIDQLKQQVAIQNDLRKWAGNPGDANSIDQPKKVIPVTKILQGVKQDFIYEMPPGSIVVLKLKTRPGI